MKKAVLLALLLCAGFTSRASAQDADTLPRRPPAGAEVAGGILGSAAGIVAGGLLGLGAELYAGADCEVAGCGAGGLAGSVIGGTLGAAGGAYLGGKIAGHDVSFARALGGAALGMAIFGGLTAAIATVDVEVAFPLAISIPLGQGLFAGGSALRRPRGN